MIEPVSDNILNLVNELYNNLDAKDKIINEQVLEITRLKETLLDIKVLIQHYGNEEKILEIINKTLGDEEWYYTH